MGKEAICTFFEHLDFIGFGETPMSFIFSKDRLTDADKETAKHIRIDLRTGRIFDDRDDEEWNKTKK